MNIQFHSFTPLKFHEESSDVINMDVFWYCLFKCDFSWKLNLFNFLHFICDTDSRFLVFPDNPSISNIVV